MTLQIKKLTTSEVIEDKWKECMAGEVLQEIFKGELIGFFSLNENRNDHDIFLLEALTFILHHPFCFPMDSYTFAFLRFQLFFFFIDCRVVGLLCLKLSLNATPQILLRVLCLCFSILSFSHLIDKSQAKP